MTVDQRLALVFATLFVAHAAAAQTEPPPLDLSAIPVPLAEEFEPTVRAQLASVRRDTETALRDGDDPTAALSTMCMVYLRYELMGAAEPCFAQLRRRSTDQPQWPYYESVMFERDGLFHRALTSARRALELSGPDLATLLRIANLEYRTGEREAAGRTYGEALDLSPSSSAGLFGLGRIAADAGLLPDAVRFYEDALVGQPEGSVIHYHLGMAYRRLGHMDQARAELAKSRRVEVTFPDPLHDRLSRLGRSREEIFEAGLRASREGRTESAAAAFRGVLADSPDDADAHFNLARALIELDEFDAAETHLRRATELKDYPQAHFNLSVLYGRTNRLHEARAALDLAVATDPENLPWRVMHARFIAQGGELDRAIASLEEIAALDPGLPEAPRALGAMLAATGQQERAAETYSILVELAPTDAEGRIGLALSRLRMGDYEAAHRGLVDATRLVPDNLALRHLQARLLASCPRPELRDGARAVELAREVVSVELTLDHAETLAMALAEVGDFDQALSWQERVTAEYDRDGRTSPPATLERLESYRKGLPFHGDWDL
ncbi:MAG: tetratricopeptide repeat protein [Acidobacteriota bacterium]|nr:tetratricopeptide repeat protein [Acidobacteriota bacterium]